MTVEAFVESCDVPPDWEEQVAIEVLTGCSHCGKRLLVTSRNGCNQTLRLGVTALRVYNEIGDELITFAALCKECAKRCGS